MAANESQAEIVESLSASQRLMQHYFAEMPQATDRATVLALGRMMTILAEMLSDVAVLVIGTRGEE